MLRHAWKTRRIVPLVSLFVRDGTFAFFMWAIKYYSKLFYCTEQGMSIRIFGDWFRQVYLDNENLTRIISCCAFAPDFHYCRSPWPIGPNDGTVRQICILKREIDANIYLLSGGDKQYMLWWWIISNLTRTITPSFSLQTSRLFLNLGGFLHTPPHLHISGHVTNAELYSKAGAAQSLPTANFRPGRSAHTQMSDILESRDEV